MPANFSTNYFINVNNTYIDICNTIISLSSQGLAQTIDSNAFNSGFNCNCNNANGAIINTQYDFSKLFALNAALQTGNGYSRFLFKIYKYGRNWISRCK
jgi:hypothetical protein